MDSRCNTITTDSSDWIPAFYYFVNSRFLQQFVRGASTSPSFQTSAPLQRVYKVFIRAAVDREVASARKIDECTSTCKQLQAFSWSFVSFAYLRESVEGLGSHQPPSSTGMVESSIWPKRPDTGAGSNKWFKQYRTEVAASCSTLIGQVASYPLDAVKTRMQAYNPTFLQCVKETYKLEGPSAFMKGNTLSGHIKGTETLIANASSGVTAPLLSSTFNRTISFSVYQRVKYAYSAHLEAVTGSSPLVVVNTLGSYPTFGTISCFGFAGAAAGAVGAAIGCPFEFVKVSQQLSEASARNKAEQTAAAATAAANTTTTTAGKAPINGINGIAATCVKGATAAATSVHEPEGLGYQGKGTIGAMKNIIKRRGVMGLWSGFHLQVLGNTLGSAIYFMTYESSKQMLATYRGSSPTSPGPVAIAGGLCGVVSWIFVYPIDSARVMYQRDCVSHLKEVVLPTPKLRYLERRMYRGLGVNMARSFVLNAVFFSAFEAIKKQINNLEV
ncbi:MAG: hypothetical protein M1812_007186 [Candelaria pacifica]|nr:MAG: hypothetical protein M1812_007186 [Candelaria pacifica]